MPWNGLRKVRSVNVSQRKPLAVRAAVGALALAAVSSFVYGIVQVTEVARIAGRGITTVIYLSEPAIIAAVMLFMSIGYGAAAYGVGRGRWGARQLGLLVSAVCIPTGLLLGFMDYYNLVVVRDSSGLLLVRAAKCIAITAGLCGALLGTATLGRRAVRDHLAARVVAPTAARVARQLVRAKVMLVTVAIALTAAATWMAATISLGVRGQVERGESGGALVASVAVIAVVLMLLVGPAGMCLLAARFLRSRQGARRLALVGLWSYTLLALPLMMVTAIAMTGGNRSDDLFWRLGMSAGLLSELIAAGCVIATVLVLNHPGLAPYFRPPAPALSVWTLDAASSR